MKLMNKLERKFGRYAIQNLSLYIVGAYVVGYILQLFVPDFYNMLLLKPQYILKGQVWRLVTWVLTPPSELSFWTIIMIICYYSIGNSLEAAWGRFRFNLYIFSGIFFTVIGAMIAYFFIGSNYPYGSQVSTYYINLAIFLGYAFTFPESKMYIYFVIPIKTKWLGVLYCILIVYSFINATSIGKVIIFSSLLNVILFLLGNKNINRYAPKEMKRRQTYKKEVRQSSGTTRHKCAICGRTELDGENLEFRYCSKCEGNYEYCQDHLFTHEHKKR